MAGFGVLITSVIFITIVTGDTLQLVALVGLTALTSAPNPATTICTNVGSKARDQLLTMEKMNIDINLSGQEEGKYRTFYLVIGTCGLIWITLTLLFPDLGLRHFYFSWIVFLPGFIEAILYGLGKKRMFADNFPYLRINEERIEKSKGGLFAKPDISYWVDIKSIEIKLFELHLTTADNRLKKVDLTNLTDDNLKIVKEFVTTLKQNKGL